MTPTRIVTLLASLALFAFAGSFGASADHHEKPEAKAWDQQAVGALAEQFATDSKVAYTAVYNQGGTSGSVGSGSRRDYFRLRDTVRVIDREARHLRAAIRDGKGHDETLSIFQRLMVEVRSARVYGRRVMLLEGTLAKISAAAGSLEKIGEYYDPSAFTQGTAPPLVEPAK